MLGYISEAEKLTYYAHAAAVFFGPYDEDYGYITLEAMLSSRPVLTCSDSGGPLDLSNTIILAGFVTQNLNSSPNKSTGSTNIVLVLKNGLAGRAHYEKLDINWRRVVEKLTSK